MDFFDALDIESKLGVAIGPYIKELMKIPLKELIVHSEGGTWWRCPICKKVFSNFGQDLGYAKMLRHYRWRECRWELLKLIDNVENLPRKFEHYQHDFAYGDDTCMLRKIVKKWVICAKILYTLNPRSINLGYDLDSIKDRREMEIRGEQKVL